MRRAQKVGMSLSEAIEMYLEVYAVMPVEKYVATGEPVKGPPYPTEVIDKY